MRLPLRATARSFLGVVNQALRAYPAFSAGDTSPRPLTAPGFLSLQEGQKTALIELLDQLELVRITRVVIPNKPNDMFKFSIRERMGELFWIVQSKDLTQLLRFFEPVWLLESADPEDREALILAEMLGLRLNFTHKRVRGPVGARLTWEEIRDLVQPGEKIPVRELYGRMVAKGASPVHHREVMAELFSPEGLRLEQPEGSEFAFQRYHGVEGGLIQEDRYPLDQIGGWFEVSRA